MGDRPTIEKREPRIWVEPFLQALTETGNVSEACKRAQVHRSVVYSFKDQDEVFLKRWLDAREEGVDAVESALRVSAVEGVKTATVIERTEKDGSKTVTKQIETKPSVTAQIFLLKSHRPEIYREGPGKGEGLPMVVVQQVFVNVYQVLARILPLELFEKAVAELNASSTEIIEGTATVIGDDDGAVRSNL